MTEPQGQQNADSPLPDAPGDAPVDPIDHLAEHLRELGAESETERAVKRIVPWVTSVMFHASLIFLGFVVVFAARFTTREDPVLIVADIQSLRYQPVSMLSPDLAEEDQETLQDQVRTDAISRTLSEQLRALDVDPLSMISDAASPTDLARFAPQPSRGTARFAGLTGTNARRIAFVVDASGSMITVFGIVIEELQKSIEQLTPEQEFSIIFFQGEEALISPPVDRMIAATQPEKIRTFRWLEREVRPRSMTNPIPAIRHALSLKPDVIFVLSDNFTGGGRFEVDQGDVLAMLDELNPINPETGRRRMQIKCVQFLYPDPLETLKKIGEIHGGENGYRFMSARELGLE